jgi:N-acetylmuramoyl-L-alanine amidase
MPSVLVELGFLSNTGDAALLGSDSFRQQAAEALAEGVKRALSQLGEDE